MRILISLLPLLLGTGFSWGQSLDNPLDNIPLPDRFTGMEQSLAVNHFPDSVHPTPGLKGDPAAWYWKHNTAVIAREEITILEAGAFLLGKDSWQLRVEFSPREFAKLFACEKAVLNPNEPYTFPKNWRSGDEIFPGWAAWYFIGINSEGEKVFGWSPVYTSDTL